LRKAASFQQTHLARQPASNRDNWNKAASNCHQAADSERKNSSDSHKEKSMNLSARTLPAIAICISITIQLAANAFAQNPQPDDRSIRPFKVQVPQAALDDLRHRINATRWPDKETVAGPAQGVPLASLQPLIRYWGTGYDWRKVEAKLNALPQFTTRIEGVDIHFLHVRSRHANALPIIVTHGWPGSVIELLKIIDPLTNPTAFGGREEDAFDVVIPSLPGFGFSGRPTDTGWKPERIALAWAELMKRLGYTSYVAQGGDWGAPVSSEMARRKVSGLLGIHVNLPATVPSEVAVAIPGAGPAPAGLSDQERKVFDALRKYGATGGPAYFTMLTARPQTVGYGVTDSPAGLAAWLLVHPGFKDWKYGADPGQSPTRDEVLDNFTLYWLTNTATSAGRIYWENGGQSAIVAAPWKTTEIALPVAITAFPEDVYLPPESWARRAYPNLIYFNEASRGGHFAAWEEPQLFATELRAAFRSLRPAQLSGIKRIDLQQHDLSFPGREAVQVIVELAPGVVAPRHSHPGEEVVYVLYGTLEYTIDGKPPVTMKAGDVLFVPAGAIHSARNVGTVNGAELATYIVEKGKQLLVQAQ
jgi:quercetin dioxygenase-like cupin family protein/pimeloyl-ACP methyl ester carboxylesterase